MIGLRAEPIVSGDSDLIGIGRHLGIAVVSVGAHLAGQNARAVVGNTQRQGAGHGRVAVGGTTLAATHCELAKWLAEREEKAEALAMNHNTFSHNTRAQIKKVFAALREPMTPPDPSKRPIAFDTPEDKGKTASGATRKT